MGRRLGHLERGRLLHGLLSLSRAQLELLQTALELLLRQAQRLLLVVLQLEALHARLGLLGGGRHLRRGALGQFGLQRG